MLVLDRCTVCTRCTIGSKIILDAPTVVLGEWKLVSVRLEIVLVLVQDRCMVCARHSIGSKIVLDAPGGTPRSEVQVEAHFGPFGDSANVDAR